MTELVIKAQKRENTGKGSARKFRAQGLIPGEFYSSHEGNYHILLNQKEFETLLPEARGLVSLKIEGAKKSFPCVIKDIQREPVKENILHVDFQGVKRGEKLTVKVPVVLVGTAEGVKAGGILEHMIRELEVECLPKDIPDKLEIDITEFKIGDALHVKDLEFGNIRIMDDPEETILLIEHSRVARELPEEAAEEEEVEEITEPEVITARKEEEQED